MRIHDLAQSLPQAAGRMLGGAGQSDDFANTLKDALKEVNQAQLDSKGLQNRLMADQPVDISDLMIQMEKASTAMQLTMQVRNKLLEAYQEINKMQI